MTQSTDEPVSFTLRPVAGDDRDRLVCDTCGWIDYENPKIVVGSVVEVRDGGAAKLLLCRRAIEPRRGFWTLPAGFLEHNETAEEGARREALEEANADIAIHALLGVYSIARISQIQLIYLASLPVVKFSAGPESAEVALFAWDEIPWRELAFPSVHWALNHYREIGDRMSFQPFVNPPGSDGDRLPPGL